MSNKIPDYTIFRKQNSQRVHCFSYTFLSFFIFEGGHRPFFLIILLRIRRFLLSLTFFAIFIFIFCSSFSCNFDSSGRFWIGMLSSSFSDWSSASPAGLSAAEALTMIAHLCRVISGAWACKPCLNVGCNATETFCSLIAEIPHQNEIYIIITYSIYYGHKRYDQGLERVGWRQTIPMTRRLRSIYISEQNEIYIKVVNSTTSKSQV